MDEANLVLRFGRHPLGNQVGHMVFHITDIGDRLARMTCAHTKDKSLRIRRRTKRQRTCNNGGNTRRDLSCVLQNEPPIQVD